jgi:hypothetical protein
LPEIQRDRGLCPVACEWPLSENEPDSYGAIVSSFVAVLDVVVALAVFKGDVRII